MKRLFLSIIFFTLFGSTLFAQNSTSYLDSLKQLLIVAPNDTSRILRIAEIAHDFGYLNYDSGLHYGQQALALSEPLGYERGKVRAIFALGSTYLTHGDIAQSLALQLNGLQLAEQHHYTLERASCLMGIGFCYKLLGDHPKAINFYKEASRLARTVHENDGLNYISYESRIGLGDCFREINQLDSALTCLQGLYQEPHLPPIWRAVVLQSLGDVYSLTGNHHRALDCLHQSLALDLQNKDTYSLVWAHTSLASLFRKMGQRDSSLWYARKGLTIAEGINTKEGILNASLLLAEQYELTDPKEAIRYRKIYDGAMAILYGPKKVMALQKTLLDEQERQRKIEADRIAYWNQLKQYGFLAGVGVLLLIAFFLYRNNQKEKRGKMELQEKNELIEQTLTDLRLTQSQLIQSEKMASLGELTAGIAHEIQNPLNFVNNFSEVSAELLDEMKAELAVGNLQPAKEIADDVKQNLEKIVHHGKRADAIVKGMLQHSRSSSGVKEPTDINALADEYLRLAYHGLRAKDKSFNATMKTDFDTTIGAIPIIPQDIGRVILNLVMNGFYAVTEEKKVAGDIFEPIVSLVTKKTGNKIEVRVRDNGPGIPKDVVDKIFQPFFTTKPTGQGTGLGLSLSYDIIKAHGGEIKVETSPGNGTEFTVLLPAT